MDASRIVGCVARGREKKEKEECKRSIVASIRPGIS
jgi:hypothetical protein